MAEEKETGSLIAKSREALLSAKRTGELEEIAANMEAKMAEREQEASAKLKHMSELRQKAKSGLLGAARSGELQTLAAQYDEIEAQEAALKAEQEKINFHHARLEQSKEDLMKDIKMKAKQGILNAKKSGELEALADDMEKEMARIEKQKEELEKAKESMAATKKRAAAGMLRAYRDGELEAIADDLEKKQEALEQKKAHLKDMKAKASRGILDAKRSGQLEKLADEMENLQKEIEQEQVVQAAMASEIKQDLPASKGELDQIRVKARTNLLNAKRSGELNNIAFQMAQMETLEAEIQETVADFTVLRAKAKANLLGAYRSGELEQIQMEMEAKQREAEEKAAQFKELKNKARRNLMEAKRTGELEILATSMEATHDDILTEMAVNVDIVKSEVSTKKKAGQALLKAHRSGELEAIADDMERKLNQLNQTTEAVRKEGTAADIERLHDVEEAIGEMNKDATELAAKAKEYEELKLKAKKALLDAKKSGELEQIANDMEAAQKEIEEKAARIKETKSRFQANMVGAYRTGELQKVFDTFEATEMDAALVSAQVAEEVEQTAIIAGTATHATKQKARRTLLNAKRAGELEWIAQGLPGEFEHMNLGVLPMGVQRRKKAPIDLQARNLGGVDVYSYYAEGSGETAPRFMKQGAKRSVPSKLRDALLTAEEFPVMLGKPGASAPSTEFLKRNPGFKF
jgi:hypothetical protein